MGDIFRACPDMTFALNGMKHMQLFDILCLYRAIRRAVNNLAPPDKRVSDAVDVRMELDLRIGKLMAKQPAEISVVKCTQYKAEQ